MSTALLFTILLAPRPAYHIQARLDPIAHTIEGTLDLRWNNPADRPLKTLPFHLYMNAFSGFQTTFMRESGGKHRRSFFKEKEGGVIRILSCTVNHQPVQGRFLAPDDANPHDRTVWEITLPQPVHPGDTVRVSMKFRVFLPRVFARTGYAGTFHMVGQWFPKIGVWEKDRGWNCHQFHYNSEFFSDFADYFVKLNLPEDMVLAHSGVLVKKEHQGPRMLYTLRGINIHDFAWCAYPAFRVYSFTFDPEKLFTPEEKARWTKILSLNSKDWKAQHPVKMVFYMSPGHEKLVWIHKNALEQALKYFSIWFGPYPYPRISVVDPPLQAVGAGGMEYPTLITTLSFLPAYWKPFRGLHFLQGITIHEFAHNYFYGLLASNEFEEAFMDEGFTTFATSLVTEELWGSKAMAIPWMDIYLSEKENFRLAHSRMEAFDTIQKPSWRFISNKHYSFHSYDHTALILHQLRNLMGDKAFFSMMRDYALTYRFRHPYLKNFLQFVERHGSPELAQRVHRWFTEDTRVDFLIYKVEKNKGGTRVTVARKGPFIGIPLHVRITLKNGKVYPLTWEGKSRWIRWNFWGDQEVQKVELDPEETILFDTHQYNNLYVKKLRKKPEIRINRFFQILLRWWT